MNMTRFKAAEVLGKFEVDYVMSRLIENFKKGRSYGQHIAEAIGTIGDGALVPSLIEALRHTDSSVRKGAIYTLGEIGNPSIISMLIKAIDDEDEYVAAMALYAVERFFERHTSTEYLEKFSSSEEIKKIEDEWVEPLANLKKVCKDKAVIRRIKFLIAKLKLKTAEMKNKLAEKKDILLSDIPKPPKKGQIFQLRRIKHG
jgi:HEAT repeat protein